MRRFAARRPDHHHHAATQQANGDQARFAIIEAVIFNGYGMASENLRAVDFKIKAAFLKGLGALGRIAGAFCVVTIILIHRGVRV